ncbi:hypothetical protein KIPB_007586, partial [Kipferlia bialata]
AAPDVEASVLSQLVTHIARATLVIRSLQLVIPHIPGSRNSRLVQALSRTFTGSKGMVSCAAFYLSSAYVVLVASSRTSALTWPQMLPDIGLTPCFDIVPAIGHWLSIDKAYLLPDICIGVTLAVFWMGLAFIPHRWVIFRRWLVAYGICFYVRAVSMSITLLPDPSGTCMALMGEPPTNPWTAPIHVVFGKQRVCGDLMFSGHTCAAGLAVLSALSELECRKMLTRALGPIRTPRTDELLYYNAFPGLSLDAFANLWAASLCALGAVLVVLMLATRFHWSLDIYLSIVISLLVWAVLRQAEGRILRGSLIERDSGKRRLSERLALWILGDCVPHSTYTAYTGKAHVDKDRVRARVRVGEREMRVTLMGNPPRHVSS